MGGSTRAMCAGTWGGVGVGEVPSPGHGSVASRLLQSAANVISSLHVFGPVCRIQPVVSRAIPPFKGIVGSQPVTLSLVTCFNGYSLHHNYIIVNGS